MGDIQRFWCHEASNILCVRAADFDRVTAERDALQARLTAADELNDTTKAELAWQESDNAELRKRVDVLDWLLHEVEAACDLSMSAIDDDERGANFVQIIAAIKAKAALKPAEGGGDDA